MSHQSPPPTTETEIKELRDLVIGLREEMRVGFASTDTKLVELKAEMNMGFANVDTKFAELSEMLRRSTRN